MSYLWNIQKGGQVFEHWSFIIGIHDKHCDLFSDLQQERQGIQWHIIYDWQIIYSVYNIYILYYISFGLRI